jgi:hypothetical protein
VEFNYAVCLILQGRETVGEETINAEAGYAEIQSQEA